MVGAADGVLLTIPGSTNEFRGTQRVGMGEWSTAATQVTHLTELKPPSPNTLLDTLYELLIAELPLFGVISLSGWPSCKAKRGRSRGRKQVTREGGREGRRYGVEERGACDESSSTARRLPAARIHCRGIPREGLTFETSDTVSSPFFHRGVTLLWL